MSPNISGSLGSFDMPAGCATGSGSGNATRLGFVGVTIFALINMPPQMEAPISNVLWTLPIELSFYFCCHSSVWCHKVFGIPAITVGSDNPELAALWVGARELDNYVPLLPYLDMLPGTLLLYGWILA